MAKKFGVKMFRYTNAYIDSSAVWVSLPLYIIVGNYILNEFKSLAVSTYSIRIGVWYAIDKCISVSI